MKRCAYLESSVWNRIVDREDPERRRITRIFLDRARRKLRWFASAVVRAELGETPDLELRHELFRQLRRHRPRAVTVAPRTTAVLDGLMERGIGTPARAADMMHLALAISAGMDFLVSWDERHLANPRVERLVREYCRLTGYNLIRIGTPVQVATWVRVGLR